MKELIIEAKRENFERVMEFLNEQLEKTGCPKAVQRKLDVAAEEIFVNITSYAYEPETGDAVIRFCHKTEPDRIELTFIDEGIPYDPLKKEDPDISMPVMQRKIGGLGIYMVKKTMDDVRYERTEGKNILTIMKRMEM